MASSDKGKSKKNVKNGLMEFDWDNGRILFRAPSSIVPQMIMGNCPDGTVNVVIARPGVNVINVFA